MTQRNTDDDTSHWSKARPLCPLCGNAEKTHMNRARTIFCSACYVSVSLRGNIELRPGHPDFGAAVSRKRILVQRSKL